MSSKSTKKPAGKKPVVGIIMGSKSDWEAMKKAEEMLKSLGIPCEARVMSAHRTPERAHEYLSNAKKNGLKVIIAAAGMAAHLAGVAAATTRLPVLGVPMDGSSLNGLDALLSTVQMPPGIPVGTLAIGPAGAKNAALLAAAILALSDDALDKRLEAFRKKQAAEVPEFPY